MAEQTLQPPKERLVDWKYQTDPAIKAKAEAITDPKGVSHFGVEATIRGAKIGEMLGDGGDLPDRTASMMDELDAATPRNPRYKSLAPVGRALDKEIVPLLTQGRTNDAIAVVERLLNEKGPPPQNVETVKNFRVKQLEELLTETQLSLGDRPDIQGQIVSILKQAKVGVGDAGTEKPTAEKFARDNSLSAHWDSLVKDAAADFTRNALTQEDVRALIERLQDPNFTSQEFLVSLVSSGNLKDVIKGSDKDSILSEINKIYKEKRGIAKPEEDDGFLTIQRALEKAAINDIKGARVEAAELILKTSTLDSNSPKQFNSLADIPKPDLLMMRLLSGIDDKETLHDCVAKFASGSAYEAKLANRGIIALYDNDGVRGQLRGDDIVRTVYALAATKGAHDKLETLAMLKMIGDTEVGNPKERFDQRVRNGLYALDGKIDLDDLAKTTIGEVVRKPGDASLVLEAYNSPNRRDFAAVVASLAIVDIGNGSSNLMNAEQLRSFLAATNIVGKVELDNARTAAWGALANHQGKCESKNGLDIILDNTKQFRANLKTALGMTSEAFDKIYPNY